MAGKNEIWKLQLDVSTNAEKAEGEIRSFAVKSKRDIESIESYRKASLNRQLSTSKRANQIVAKNETDLTKIIVAELKKRNDAERLSNKLANKMYEGRMASIKKIRPSEVMRSPLPGVQGAHKPGWLGKIGKIGSGKGRILGPAGDRIHAGLPGQMITPENSMFATNIMTPKMEKAEEKHKAIEQKQQDLTNDWLRAKDAHAEAIKTAANIEWEKKKVLDAKNERERRALERAELYGFKKADPKNGPTQGPYGVDGSEEYQARRAEAKSIIKPTGGPTYGSYKEQGPYGADKIVVQRTRDYVKFWEKAIAEDEKQKSQAEAAYEKYCKEELAKEEKILAEKNKEYDQWVKAQAKLEAEAQDEIDKRDALRDENSRKAYANFWIRELEEQEEKKKLEEAWLKAKEKHENKKLKEQERARKKEESEARAKYRQLLKGLSQTAAMKKRGAAAMRRAAKQRRDSYAKDIDIVKKSPMDIRNSIGSISTAVSQFIGETTMFVGAAMMVTMMAGRAFNSMMAVGDKFASVERNFNATMGMRGYLAKTGGANSVYDYDKANELNMRLSGMTKFGSGELLARQVNTLKEEGSSLSRNTMSSLVLAGHGVKALTGKEIEQTMGMVTSVAKSRKGLEKLGLSDKSVKLTQSIDENIKIIAKALLKDDLASSAMKRGTVESAMAGIKNAPTTLFENVFEAQSEQINSIFNNVANNVVSAANSDKVVYAWRRALTNFDEVAANVLTPERLEAAGVGAARWAAEFAVIGGHMIEAGLWMLGNSDKVLEFIKNATLVFAGIAGIKVVAGMYNLALDIGKVAGAISRLGEAAVKYYKDLEDVSVVVARIGEGFAALKTGLFAFLGGLIDILAKFRFSAGLPLMWLFRSQKAGEGSDDLSKIAGKLTSEQLKELRDIGFKMDESYLKDGTGRETFNSIMNDQDMNTYLRSMYQSQQLAIDGMSKLKLQGEFDPRYTANTSGYGYTPNFTISGDVVINPNLIIEEYLSENTGQ